MRGRGGGGGGALAAAGGGGDRAGLGGDGAGVGAGAGPQHGQQHRQQHQPVEQPEYHRQAEHLHTICRYHYILMFLILNFESESKSIWHEADGGKIFASF